jgi:hypothetical protein
LKLLDPNQWWRNRHSRSVAFFATLDEIHSAISGGLVPEYAPYSFATWVRSGRNGGRSEVISVDALASQTLETLTCADQLFLFSEKLTDLKSGESDWYMPASWSLSGLIILQIGRQRWDKKYEPSALGMVARVESREGEDRLEHPEYERVYNAVKRRLNRMLCYTTIQDFADGSTLESNLERMTAGAAQAYRNGFPFLFPPGGLIQKKR